MSATEPAPSNKHTSFQAYGTPPEFLRAVEARFGRITFDLAATAENAVAPYFYSPQVDSLKQDWRLEGMPGVAFLNPPFADIQPWAAKLEAECRYLSRWTLMLVPASIDTRWYNDHVLHKMMVWGISRMKFVGGESTFPKALILIGSGFGVAGHSEWQWNKESK